MSTGTDDFRQRWRELARAFLTLGALSYGGAAIMGIMQAEIQQKRGWLTKERYLEGFSLVQILPGAPATQLSIFIGHERAGWREHRGRPRPGHGFQLHRAPWQRH